VALVAQYNPPFEGMDVSTPAQFVSRQAAPSINNFVLRQNYIQSRFRFQPFPGISPTNGEITGLGLGLDTRTSYTVSYWLYAHVGSAGIGQNPTLQSLHGDLWQNEGSLGAASTFIWDWINTAGYIGGSIVPTAGMAFVDGSQHVYFISGPGAGIVDLTQGQYGANFLMELAQFLIIANTIEGGQNIQQRVRWSAGPHIDQWSGNPTSSSGTPAINNAWGFVDLLDASDIITGTLSLGNVGYILRTNGITQVTPTGNGLQPFDFNHLWASQLGIGQVFPNTRAQYGALAILISEDNVYNLTINSISTVGDKVIDQIIYDIAQYNPDFYPYTQNIYASISPRDAANYRYLVYKLFIGAFNVPTIVWTYDLHNRNWVREELSLGLTPSAQPIFVDTNTAPIPGNLLVPVNTVLYQYDLSNLDCESPGTYIFKIEGQQDLTYLSVSWIGISYINIGVGSITVSLTGPMYNESQTLTLGDPTKDKIYYNGGTPPAVLADGLQYLAFFSFKPLTDAFFQVSITRVANSGPVKIVQVSVYGEGQEVPR